MKKIFTIALLLCTFYTAQSQYYKPESPLIFKQNQITTAAISQKIRQARAFFSALDIEELKPKIKRNNNEVDNRISILKNKMSNAFMDKQELLKLKDISKIKERITEMEKNREKIKQEIQQDMANIGYQGLYVVVLKNIDILDSKEKLAQKAERLLAPQAVEDLNGVFISSLTVVKNNKLLTDKIKSAISGEMSIEKQYITATIDRRSKFLYLVKVNVSPLKKAIKTSSGGAAPAQNYLTINLLADYNYKSKLQTFGVSDEDIKNIEFEANSSQESINLANSTASRRQREILERGQDNLQKLDKEIDELKNSLYNRSDVLRKTIERTTNVTFNENNISASIRAALKSFDDKIQRLKDELMAAKEKELIGSNEVNVTAEGSPDQDIARTAIDVYKQIKQSYSKVEQFLEVTEVENYRVTNYQRGGSADLYRDVDRIWLYPVPGDRDNFLLTVVAQFKISSLRKSGASSPGISTPAPSGGMVFVQAAPLRWAAITGALMRNLCIRYM